MPLVKTRGEVNRGLQPPPEIRIAPRLLALDTPPEALFNRCRQIAQNFLGFPDQWLAQKEFDACFPSGLSVVRSPPRHHTRRGT
jgi:hypothetical protein